VLQDSYMSYSAVHGHYLVRSYLSISPPFCTYMFDIVALRTMHYLGVGEETVGCLVIHIVDIAQFWLNFKIFMDSEHVFTAY
jgi:hypothetical protein